MSTSLAPHGFYPPIALDSSGLLSIKVPDSSFARALIVSAIAIDEMGKPLFAKQPLPRQRALVSRIKRALRDDDHCVTSAAATVLLNVCEGARHAKLRSEALDAYFQILGRTKSRRLRESMVLNLDRAKRVLDDDGRVELARLWQRVSPTHPPYDAWFGNGKNVLRISCQVQDVFYATWRKIFRKEGFRTTATKGARHVVFEKTIEGTTFRIDYRQKAERIFGPMHDPHVDVDLFLGHSDWWARVPRNLEHAPAQRGAKLLILILCFGKHFYHSLRERYPKAFVITSKDPTEDPEDVVMLRHLFDGIAKRKSWLAIRRSVDSDPKSEKNFVMPGDTHYLAGVNDEDRDGKIDRFDRFCAVRRPARESSDGTEESFVADPLDVHPRGVAVHPRELDGSTAFEAALMLNSLSYDNFYLDQVNQDQRVVSGGFHLPRPGELDVIRIAKGKRDGREILRMTVNARYARATQAALTAMVTYEGWQWFAKTLKRKQRLSPLDTNLMGIVLVAQSLANANFKHPDEVFAAFLRRFGFPDIPFHTVEKTIEVDDRYESGSPKSIRALKKALPSPLLDRLEQLAHA